jgi:hypothetical protein
MMPAQPVSADTVSYDDRPDDLARSWEVTSLDPYNYILAKEWSDYSKVGQVGYLDITNGWLTRDGDSLSFGMEVAGDMPTEGTIPGVSYVVWGFYTFFDNNFDDCFDIYLLWDGVDYEAWAQDSRPFLTGGTWEYTEITPAVGENTLVLTVSASELEFPEEFYWCFKTLMIMGNLAPTPATLDDFKGGTLLWADLTDPEDSVSPHPLPALAFFPMLPSPP